MINILLEIAKNIGIGFKSGIDILLQLIPIYDKLGGLKEEIIAMMIGAPVILVSLIKCALNIFTKYKNS